MSLNVFKLFLLICIFWLIGKRINERKCDKSLFSNGRAGFIKHYFGRNVVIFENPHFDGLDVYDESGKYMGFIPNNLLCLEFIKYLNDLEYQLNGGLMC